MCAEELTTSRLGQILKCVRILSEWSALYYFIKEDSSDLINKYFIKYFIKYEYQRPGEAPLELLGRFLFLTRFSIICYKFMWLKLYLKSTVMYTYCVQLPYKGTHTHFLNILIYF